MFDELDNNREKIEKKEEIETTEAHSDKILENQDNEVEDIFSNGDNDDFNLKASSLEEPPYNEGKEKPSVFSPKEKEKKEEERLEKSFSFLRLLIIIIFLSVFLGGGYFVYDKYLKDIIFSSNILEQKSSRDVGDDDLVLDVEQDFLIEPILNNEQKELDKNDNNIVTNNTSKIVDEKDSDGDGLSDVRERSLGLNINNIDTDGDGLFDREEVKVYKTDPKNMDTDGDSFSDGDEVNAGYNPNGPGKLYDINQ